MNEILVFDNVSLNYHTKTGETNAVKDISFKINEGEFVSFVGPSGCGKTSLLSMVAGILKPSSGKIFIDGLEIIKPTHDIGYMLQKDQLFDWRNIYKNITIGLEIKNLKTEENFERVNLLLEKYGLKEFAKYYPNQLSGGMRQRAALIRTLVLNPKILLLDEPFSALDYQTRLNACNDVHNIIKSEGKTALFVTHDISEAISISDRIFVLTKRPAELLNVHTINIPKELTPLKRRENPEFVKIFDRIWGEISQ